MCNLSVFPNILISLSAAVNILQSDHCYVMALIRLGSLTTHVLLILQLGVACAIILAGVKAVYC